MTALTPRPNRAAAPPTVLLGRLAAVLALGSALVHLVLLDVSALGSLAMAGMALACLPCAWHLWRSPTGGVWAVTATVDAAMLAVHAQLLSTHPGHVHTASGPGSPMYLGLGLVALQLVLAAIAGLAAARR